VRSTHLHALGRDVPDSLLSVELVAGGAPYLAGTDTGEGEELESGFEGRPAVVLIDRHKEPAEFSFISDRGAADGFRRLESALKGQGGVGIGAESNNRQPKDTADHAA